MRTSAAALGKQGELGPTMLSNTLSVPWAAFGTHAESGLSSASNRPSSTRWSSSGPYCRFVRRQIQPPRSPRPDHLAPTPACPSHRGSLHRFPSVLPPASPSTTSSCFLITPSRPSTRIPAPPRRPQPLRFSHPHPRSASDPGRSHRVGAGSDARSFANPIREAEGLRTARPRFRSQPGRLKLGPVWAHGRNPAGHLVGFGQRKTPG